MPCGKKYKKVRSKDVGRPGHHYIKIGIKEGGGSEAIGGLRKYKKRRKKNMPKKKKHRKK